MNLFLCDIEGTYKGIENREEVLKRFINNLNKINEIDDSKMIFSFISDDNYSEVNECFDEIKKYLTDNIKLGFQYSSDYIFNNNNIIKSNYRSKIEKCFDASNIDNINKIFYADDSVMNQIIVVESLKIKHPNVEIIGLNPSRGLNDLNIEIEKYLKSKTKQLVLK